MISATDHQSPLLTAGEPIGCLGFAFLREGVKRDSLAVWDTILLETENFVVLPTIGSLVEGWLLVVAKSPLLCMAQLPPSCLTEYVEVKSFVADAIHSTYGNVAVFEHGPATPGSSVGCTVDQAHVHIVPWGDDLIAGVPNVAGRQLEWSETDGLEDAAKLVAAGRSYLYCEVPGSQARIACADQTPSQLFRRVIANTLGIPDQFDWRNHHFCSNAQATVDRLHAVFASRFSETR